MGRAVGGLWRGGFSLRRGARGDGGRGIAGRSFGTSPRRRAAGSHLGARTAFAKFTLARFTCVRCPAYSLNRVGADTLSAAQTGSLCAPQLDASRLKRAFSSEADSGSREENASNRNLVFLGGDRWDRRFRRRGLR